MPQIRDDRTLGLARAFDGAAVYHRDTLVYVTDVYFDDGNIMCVLVDHETDAIYHTPMRGLDLVGVLEFIELHAW